MHSGRPLRSAGSSGVLAVEPSTITGELVRVIVGTLKSKSQNRKTGDVVQVTFAPHATEPRKAGRSGADQAVCGDCPHRPSHWGTCYVNIGQSVQSSWLYSSTEPEPDVIQRVRRRNVPVRLGAWGDPASVAFEVVAPLLDASEGPRGRRRTFGYTHLWRTCDPRWRGVVMASCDSPEDRADAKARGWRTFRVRPVGAPLEPGEIECPATSRGGRKTTCAKCLLCSGTGGRGLADVSAEVHGASYRRATFRKNHSGQKMSETA